MTTHRAILTSNNYGRVRIQWNSLDEEITAAGARQLAYALLDVASAADSAKATEEERILSCLLRLNHERATHQEG